jgi:ABC-type ATPase involved in cell division
MAPVAILGYFLGQFALAGISPWLFMAAVLPHSVLELPAAAILIAAATRTGAMFMKPPGEKTVMENVTFKMRALGDFREQAEEKALAALDQVGLISKSTYMVTELEDVDRVRLGIALSICDDPLLLLLDDPLVGLSPEEQKDIYDLLIELNRRGFTILVTARDALPNLDSSTRVVEMIDGRLEERT